MGSIVHKLLTLRTSISKLSYIMLYSDNSMILEGFFESSESVTVLLYLRVSLAANILQGPFPYKSTNL